MASNIPFFRGQNVVLKFFQDNKPIYIAAKNWDVEENATEIADGVNGEHRDRLDRVANYYTASVDIFQTDQEVVAAYLANQDNDDANGLPLKQSGAIQINHRDGTRAAYILQEMVMGPMKISNSSRQEAVMLNLKVRFRFFKPSPAI
jgi:hypothetical protein